MYKCHKRDRERLCTEYSYQIHARLHVNYARIRTGILNKKQTCVPPFSSIYTYICVCVIYTLQWYIYGKHNAFPFSRVFWFRHLDKHVPNDSHSYHTKIGTDKVNRLAFRTSSQKRQILTTIVSVTCSVGKTNTINHAERQATGVCAEVLPWDGPVGIQGMKCMHDSHFN